LIEFARTVPRSPWRMVRLVRRFRFRPWCHEPLGP